MNAKTQTIVGSIMMIISLFMPIATVSAGFLSRSINGYESDLVFSGILGFILLLVGLFSKGTPGKRFSPIATVLSGISIINVLILFVKVTGINANEIVASSMGLALPICGLGALLTFVAGLKYLPSEPNLTTDLPSATDISTQPRKPVK